MSAARRKPGHASCAARVHHLSLPEVPSAWGMYWYRSTCGFGRAECSNAGVVNKTHEYKYFESREPGEVPHWVKKDSISTLMDLHEKLACASGILADVTLNPNL